MYCLIYNVILLNIHVLFFVTALVCMTKYFFAQKPVAAITFLKPEVILYLSTEVDTAYRISYFGLCQYITRF